MTTLPVQVRRYEGGVPRDVTDDLTIEDVLQINVDGEPFSVTMRSPGHDIELVRGLLFTEHVLDDPLAEVTLEQVADPRTQRVLRVDVRTRGAGVSQSIVRSRSLLSTSSCGLCGKREMQGDTIAGTPLRARAPLDVALIPRMQVSLRESQAAFRRSGGSHAAGAFRADGAPLAIFEDVGRHNAVDKVIGALLLSSRLSDADCLLVSGRISYEIVTKAYAAGIPIIVAVSAPSSLAVKTARDLGMSLLGFCRDDRATVYCNPHNVVSAACPR